jgi:adenylyl-sulfate kinase
MIDIKPILDTVERAGQAVLDAKNEENTLATRQYEEMLADAYLRARSCIVREISLLTPHIPIWSDGLGDYSEFCHGCEKNWVVTSFDNALDFKDGGQLTIDIALIEQGAPVLGLVHLPCQKITYWGAQGLGAFKILASGEVLGISLKMPVPGLSKRENIEPFSAISYMPGNMNVVEGSTDMVKLNHSLKICVIIEGLSDLTFTMTSESRLDLAAGHAIVSAAGGDILAYPSLAPLRYISDTPIQPKKFFISTNNSVPYMFPKDEGWKDDIIYERRQNDSKADVIWHRTQVDEQMRATSLNQRPRCIWLTGLSGSGKSTIANSLELCLHNAGRHTFLLDGDNVRQGLNKDLGMSSEDRAENIRRVGEVAKLMVDAGLIVVTAFISPFRADRAQVRALFTEGSFVEVFVDTPLDECERRDVKGLYAKARRGELKDFTGIDSRYEAPIKPDVHLFPGESTLKDCVKTLINALEEPCS